MAIQDDSNDKYLSISRSKYFFSVSDKPIHDILYCLQASNGQFLHLQHHEKVIPFPSWILPMLSWFYVQDRYLSCSRTILVSQFHPQEAIDTKKVHGYSQIPNRYHPVYYTIVVRGGSKQRAALLVAVLGGQNHTVHINQIYKINSKHQEINF